MSSQESRVPRKVALCYVRLSYTKDQSDLQSPERQKANIQRICDREGWIPPHHSYHDGTCMVMIMSVPGDSQQDVGGIKSRF